MSSDIVRSDALQEPYYTRIDTWEGYLRLLYTDLICQNFDLNSFGGYSASFFFLIFLLRSHQSITALCLKVSFLHRVSHNWRYTSQVIIFSLECRLMSFAQNLLNSHSLDWLKKDVSSVCLHDPSACCTLQCSRTHEHFYVTRTVL